MEILVTKPLYLVIHKVSFREMKLFFVETN